MTRAGRLSVWGKSDSEGWKQVACGAPRPTAPCRIASGPSLFFAWLPLLPSLRLPVQERISDLCLVELLELLPRTASEVLVAPPLDRWLSGLEGAS